MKSVKNVEYASTSKRRLDLNIPPRPDDIHATPPEEHPSKSTKWFNRAGLIALLIIAAILLVIFRWSFQDTQVLTVKNAPFPVRTIRQHLQDNGVVILSADFCKNSDVTGQLRMSFVSDSREVFLPEAQERGKKGCQQTEVPVIIPKDLAPDDYKIKFRIAYDVNPLKKNVMTEFESQKFTVYPPDPNDQ